jgi:hypothetical protein
MLYNLKKKNFPSGDYYYFSDNILEDNLYNRLVNSFPDKNDAISENFNFQNSRVRIRSINLENFLQKNKDWNAFISYLKSTQSIELFGKLFDESFDRRNYFLEKKNNFINYLHNKIFNKKKISVSIDLSLAGKDYFNKPHLDRSFRKFIMLIYFSDQQEDEIIGGEFVFHRLKKNFNKNKFDRFFDNDELDLFKMFPIKKNTALIFKNDINSIHSVNKIISFKSHRRFLYYGININ